MGYVAEVALRLLRKNPAPRFPLPFPTDEELANGCVVTVVCGKIPSPPTGMAGIGLVADERVKGPLCHRRDQTARSTSSFFVSAIALAGFNPFGQTLAQFMIVWQR